MNKYKKVQYRVCRKGHEYFPHVRFKKIFGWGRWQKIAKHPSGYGLYPLPDFEYGDTYDNCLDTIESFHVWANVVCNYHVNPNPF